MKPASRSKTLWFNVVTVALIVASFGVDSLDLLGLSEPVADAVTFGLGLLNAVGNGVLRLYTFAPIEGSPGAEQAMK